MSSVTTNASVGGSVEDRSASASSPTPGAAVLSAAMKYVQNNAGSLSLASSDSHAVVCPSAGADVNQSVSSVVLPKPAGADTSVSADSPARPRRSFSLERATNPRRRAGT